LFEFPHPGCSPIDVQEFAAAKDDPAIIHFTTEWKPWDYQNRHPYRDRFFEELDKTAWAGWRPEKPEFDFKVWWSQRSVHVVRWLTINYRKLSATWSLAR
jgi:lipopolysaccharide biosynthesis glycosyltransferase